MGDVGVSAKDEHEFGAESHFDVSAETSLRVVGGMRCAPSRLRRCIAASFIVWECCKRDCAFKAQPGGFVSRGASLIVTSVGVHL